MANPPPSSPTYIVYGCPLECYAQRFPEAVIFKISNPVPIFWSDFSLLEADLECMEWLLKKHNTWKYFINQAGTALPAVI